MPQFHGGHRCRESRSGTFVRAEERSPRCLACVLVRSPTSVNTSDPTLRHGVLESYLGQFLLLTPIPLPSAIRPSHLHRKEHLRCTGIGWRVGGAELAFEHGREQSIVPTQAQSKENIDLPDVTSERIIVLGSNQGSKATGCRSIQCLPRSVQIWPLVLKGAGCVCIHRNAPGLHSTPGVLLVLPPGPEILVSASLVHASHFPVRYMLPSIPDVPDDPSARVAELSVAG